MTGKLIRLKKIGKYPDPQKDPEQKAPAEVAKKFPKGAGLRRSTDGTWYAFIEEEVPRQPRKKKYMAVGRRLHWLEGSEIRRASQALSRADPPTFDRTLGVAYQVHDGTALAEMDLRNGVYRLVEVEGIAWKPKEE